MRSATIGESGSAALMVTAWPSSMPSAVVSLTILLLRCGRSESLIRPALQSCPGLAAVGAAHHAVDLERGVDLVRLLRVLREAHHARGERALAMLADLGRRELAPVRAAVVAAIDVDRRGAGEDALGIAAVDHEAPDLLLGVGEAGARGRWRRGRCCATRRRWCRRTRSRDPSDARRPCRPRRVPSTCCQSPPVGGAAEHADLAGMVGLAEVAGDAGVDVRSGQPWLVSSIQFFLTIGHSPWSIGRKASSAGHRWSSSL